jgi:acetyl-CoA carboxylase biotin carboxyl carrier protein
MTEPAKRKPANQDLVRAVWDEARDLIKRLEGSTVQRFAVEAGDTRIEIERGMPAGVSAPAFAPGAVGAPAAGDDGAVAAGAELDGGHPIKAPLVGTFYRASGPGADPYVKEGDVVEKGQTVAIVEAMKLMNQVQADETGKVASIVANDGDWVEFEQVLMYLEPAEAEE